MKIILTGGGTGGHVYPAVSVGLYLKEHYGAELYYIGNKGNIEEKIAKQNNIPFYGISSQGLEGKSVLHKYAGFALHNTKGIFEAKALLQKLKPDYVLGTGGFASAPALAASIWMKIPYGIHEQNSVMGKVNNLFEKKAEHVFHTFPVKETAQQFHVGIPVRFKEKLETNGQFVVFTGGSGGSVKLNEFAVSFAKSHPHISCMLITGPVNYDRVKNEDLPANIDVQAYVEDMQSLYEKAKVMIARSGAGSVFEATNLGIPSIFVPLPNSADDHQKKNAEFFTQKHAAILVEQTENFDERLTKEILSLVENDQIRIELKEKMEPLASREAEKKMADLIRRFL